MGCWDVASGDWDTPPVANVLVAGRRGTRGLSAVAVTSRGSGVYAGILFLVGFALRAAAVVGNSSGDMRSRREGLSKSPERARVWRCFWGYLCLLNAGRDAVRVLPSRSCRAWLCGACKRC